MSVQYQRHITRMNRPHAPRYSPHCFLSTETIRNVLEAKSRSSLKRITIPHTSRQPPKHLLRQPHPAVAHSNLISSDYFILNGSATIHAQYLTGNIGSPVRGKKSTSVRHIFRCTQTSQSYFLNTCINLLTTLPHTIQRIVPSSRYPALRH